MGGIMITIEVFGGGCPKCKKTAANSKLAGEKLGIEFDLIHITDPVDILQRGVSSTPALAIDGQVKAMGRIPSSEEIEKWLASAN